MSRTGGPIGWTLACALAGVLAACTSVPPAPPQPTALPNGVTPQQMVADIRAAASGPAAELDVQPLRDPYVEGLRQEAAALEARGQHEEAAAVLQQALALNPADPAVLQESAEAAVLLWQFDQAGQLSRRAHALGSGVGPLCRRHWATVEQVAQAQLALAALAPATGSRAQLVAQAEASARTAQQARLDATAAREAREACTVTAPKRF